jgi:Ni/Fe-hydrogenase subunit HybB-like protein
MSSHQELKGKILSWPFFIFFVIFAVGMFVLVQRFIYGIGEVTNLNGGFAWGIWIAYDIVIGSAIACGGYALALTVYIFNKGQYHPLVRPAILASLLGYGLAGFSAFFDMGRWWQFYNMFLPSQWNFNSVMLEVGLCITAYILVLALEFAPAFLEKIGAKGLLKIFNKLLFIIVAVGILLPTMHQSSLGSLLISMGHKVYPLWQTMHFQPLLALMTALIMGFSIVIFEGSFSTVGFKRDTETHLFKNLSSVVIWLLAIFLVVRMLLVIMQGNITYVFTFDMNSLLFIFENILFVVPLLILISPTNRSSGSMLLIAAVCMLLAGSLYRFNAFLFTLNPGMGYSYFPSVPEIMVTLGLISFEIMAYIVLVRTLPVMHKNG